MLRIVNVTVTRDPPEGSSSGAGSYCGWIFLFPPPSSGVDVALAVAGAFSSYLVKSLVGVGMGRSHVWAQVIVGTLQKSVAINALITSARDLKVSRACNINDSHPSLIATA